MKKAKKLMVLLLAFVLGLGSLFAFTACSKEEDYGDKTVLRIGLYEGGWGSEWLYEVIKNFEADYPEYKVLVDGDKNKYNKSSLMGVIDTGRQDLFLCSIYLYDAVSQDKLMDITDLMNTPLNELVKTTDTATIASKMQSELDEFYTSAPTGDTTKEDKYYSVPFGGDVYSINYDRDLFNEKSFFIKKGTGNGTPIQWVDESGDLSVGQDGIADTMDDGLPISRQDFLDLLAKMKRENVTPFIWSKQSGYQKNFLYSFAANYEGKDNFNLYKTMNGEYTFEGDSTPTTITKDNAYLMQQSKGKKASLQFAYDIVSDSANFHADSGRETCDFLDAQNKYLLSAEMAKRGTDNRIAFLIDGAHWYNEAKGTVEEMEAMSPDYQDRRFGIMPFPRYDGAQTEKPTYYAAGFTEQVFIRKRAEQPEAAKLFLAYLHTEESLRICTQYSGMYRPLTYTMPNETLNKMSYYYQSLWSTFFNADVVHNVSNNPYIYTNDYYFESDWLYTCRTSNNVDLSNPFTDLIDPTKNVSVKDYADALAYTYNADKWQKDVVSKVR